MPERPHTHCQRGHPLTPENTRTWTTTKGKVRRTCRACNRASNKAAMRRRRARLADGGRGAG